MPNIQDSTVVSGAYDTSGNGGRKLIMLDDGTLFSIAKNNIATYYFIYKSTNNGSTWTQFARINLVTGGGYGSSLATDGNRLYALIHQNVGLLYFYTFDKDYNLPNVDYVAITPTLIDNQTVIGEASMVMNETKTELHTTWSSKNATYPNSFNIRYAKGTINADGSVTWGSVEQVSYINSGSSNYAQQPTIILDKNNIPHIICSVNLGANIIADFSKSLPDKKLTTNANWNNIAIFNGSSYLQAYPSSIFVPKEVNGLPNGRIWVAWYGTDATDTTQHNIRVSYSDDSGVTWSTMQKLTTGNTYSNWRASITASNNNNIYIVFDGIDPSITANRTNIRKIVHNGTNWGTISTISNVTSNDALNVSTLFNLDIDITEPLFIYQNNQTSKVGFYGTWTTTEISVQEGFVGTRDSKDNILTYSITTDGEMSTITEKVNGVVVGTKNATSGQSLIAGLTQEQWDAIKFGKYSDITGGLNTLTVEMDGNKWTYTFDKRLATDSDIEQSIKAVQDSQDTFLPSIKSMLVDKVGGSTTDTFENLIQQATVRKKASGTLKSSSDTLIFVTQYGDSVYRPYVTVSGLSFIPNYIIINYGSMEQVVYDVSTASGCVIHVWSRHIQNPYGCSYKMGANLLVGNTFTLPVMNANATYTWIAGE